MASYSAYGLTIQSDLVLPQLDESSSAPDLTVRRGRIEAPSPFPGIGRRVCSENGTVWLYCGKRGALRIREGREIVVDPAPGADLRIIHNWVIGQGLGVAMAQRGYFVLHAGVVKVGNAGVAFMGPSGSGKSTMVMALCHAGRAVLADDHAVIDDREVPVVLSGFPQVKLREDSLQTFQRHGRTAPCIAAGFIFNKTRLLAAGKMHTSHGIPAVYGCTNDKAGNAAGVVHLRTGAFPGARAVKHTCLEPEKSGGAFTHATGLCGIINRLALVVFW